MKDEEIRSGYFALLGIERAARDPEAMQRAALDRAYELRTFEIGLVWARATYFFTGQAAIFAAFALLIKEDDVAAVFIAGALAILGSMTAWLGHLAAHGARFWQQNWEHHIDLLEDELEGRLHKSIVQNRGDLRFSVSRAQIALTRIQIIFWLTMLAATPSRFFSVAKVPATDKHVAISTLLVLAATVLLGLLIKHHLHSDIRGEVSPLDRPARNRPTTKQRRTYEIIRREAPTGWPAAVSDLRQRISPPP